MKQLEKVQGTQSKWSFKWLGALSFPSRIAIGAIGVLLAALLYAAIVEIANGESLVVVDIPLNNGDQLRVIWPSPSRITADAQEVEIVLSLLPASDTIGERAYYISLQSLDRSLLLDANDNGYIVHHTLTSSSASIVLTVRLAALQKELPDRIRIDLVVFDNSGDEPLSIPPWWLWVEIGKTNIVQRAILWIVGKAGVLALVLPLLIFVWEYKRYISDGKAKDHEKFIERIEKWQFNAIEDYDQILEEIVKKGLQIYRKKHTQAEAWREDYLEVCGAIVKQTDGWENLLRLAGDVISNRSLEIASTHFVTVQRILGNLIHFHTEILPDEKTRRDFCVLNKALFERVEDAQLRITLAELICLWRKYGYDSTVLVIEAIARICVNETGYPYQRALNMLAQKCKNEGAEVRSLLRYPRLRVLLTHSEKLVDLATYDYRWPAAEVVTPPSDLSKHLKDWLDIAELCIHPFAEAVDYRRDQLLSETWIPPISWDKLEEPDNLLALFKAPGDAELCAAYLLRRLYQKEFFGRLPTFPIQLASGAAIGHGEIVDALLHSQAITWCDFLSTNREAFEGMPETDQQMLTELLIWSAGSYSALRSWMLSRAQKDEAYFIPVLRRIQYVTARTQSFGSPGLSKRLSWLPVRPQGYRQSYLVGTVHQDYTDLQYTNLLYLTPYLNEHQVYLKLLGHEKSMPGSDLRESIAAIQRESMSWPEDNLRKVLDARVRKAFGEDFPFAALLERTKVIDKPPEERLAQAAGGSLTRLLTLGHRLIERHLQQSELTKYISEETFEAILRE